MTPRGADRGLPDEATVAYVLSHPVRRQLLDELHQNGPSSPSKLAVTIDVALGNTSYHVKILHDSGFIEHARSRPVRGAIEHIYRAVLDARTEVWATPS